MQIGIWLYSFSSPKVRSCALKKKSSFVLALTLKKYKLKSNRNISLVQSIWPGISRAIVTSSYHALSRADGGVYTEAWLRSLGRAESVLGSNPLLVTILGSWEYGSYMWASFCLVIWKWKALQNGFWSFTMWLAFIPSISCRSTWKSFMSTMENMNKLSGMQTDMLFIEKGILWLPVWKVSSLWRGGEWLYIQDLEELWTDCQWYPSLASPHPAFENVRGRMLQKLLQPFVVLLEKKKKGRASVITTNPVMTKQRGKIQKK